MVEAIGMVMAYWKASMALREWRCYQCRRLIAKADLAPKSVVEVKCHCGAYNVLKVSDKQPIDSRQAIVVY